MKTSVGFKLMTCKSVAVVLTYCTTLSDIKILNENIYES